MPEMKTLTINGVKYDMPFAPAGYGLGSSNQEITSLSVLDSTKSNGWYSFYYGGDTNVNIKGNLAGGILVVQSRNDVRQFFFKESGDISLVRRYDNDTGVWNEWVDCSPSAFAPAGYGIGSNSKYLSSVTDLNNLTTSGFYAYSYSSVPANGFTLNDPFQYVYHLHVLVDNNGTIVQEITTCGQGSKDANYRVRRVKGFGNWSEWEFENPPMIAGVEYRTTERFHGKPVYIQLVNFGSLPANSSKSIQVSATGVTDVVQYYGRYKNSDGDVGATLESDSSTQSNYNIHTTAIGFTIVTQKDLSAYSAEITLKYVK